MQRIILTRFSAWVASAWIAVVFVLVASPLGLAQPPQDTSNAATWYRRAYNRLDSITPEQWTLIAEYQNIGGEPSAEVREVLHRAQPAIADLRRGANLPFSDFDLDYGQGVQMKMGHLDGMERLMRIAAADVTVRIADGNGPDAAERIATLHRMGNHLSDDRVMISALMSSGTFRVAERLIEAGFDAGAFGRSEAALLLGSIRSLEAHDPFGGLDSLAGEQFKAMETMRAALESGDRAAFADYAAIYIVDDETAARLRDMGPVELRAEMDSYAAMMDQYVAAYGNEDAKAASAELARLDEACVNGEFGVLAPILSPAFGHCYGRLDEVRRRLQERADSLEKVLGGEVGAVDLANAAVWYRRGIDRMNALDESWRHWMEALDAGRPLTPEAIDTLAPGAEAAGAAIEQFMYGAGIRRCDFSPGRDRRETFVPLYADGMRDAFRLLSLEALRREGVDAGAGRATLLAAALGMAAHLSDDRILVSSLVSQGGFRLALQVAHAQDGRRPFTEESLRELDAAVWRTGPGDPFGFIAAAAEARRIIRSPLMDWIVAADRQKRAPVLDAWLAQQDADGLIYLLAMHDAMEYDYAPAAPFNPAGAGRLSEFLLGETIQLALIDALQFGEHMKRGAAAEYQLPETIRLIGAAARMASARFEFRGAQAWIDARAAENAVEPDAER